jgi:hypothetical protein
MKKSWFFLSLLFFCKITSAQMLESSFVVPQELYETIKKDFAINNLDFSPELLDVEATIHGGKTPAQTLKLGYTQEVLDLSNYVDKIWTDFSFALKAPFELEGDFALYFVSRYKSMKVGDQTWGLGCGQAVKIKSQLKKLFSSKGLKLMTRGGHYLNLLGGDYVLLKKEGQKIKIVYFQIRDGRWSHRLCVK